MKKLWYKFCLYYIQHPMLTPFIVGFVLSQIIIKFTGTDMWSFFLVIGILMATNWMMRSVVKETLLELIKENPGLDINQIFDKVLERESPPPGRPPGPPAV